MPWAALRAAGACAPRAGRTAVSAVLVAVLLSGLLSAAPPPAAAAKTAFELNEELSQTRERLEQAKAKLEQAQAAQLAAERDVAGLDRKIELLQEHATAATSVRDAAAAKLAATQASLKQVTADLATKRDRLDQAETDLKRANDTLEARAVGAYKSGRLGYVAFLLGQGDLRAFLTRVDFLSRIVALDVRVADEIRTLRAQVQDETAALERTRAEVSAVEQQQKAETLELNKTVAERTAALKEVTDARAAKRALAAKAETDAAAWQTKTRQLENASAEIQALLKKSSSGGSVKGTGQFVWPVEGVLTSPFGQRENPIFHTTEMHTGIDIGIDEGTPIHAADDGTVVLADWKGGYGKCVIISHGNGLSTLYGHQSKLMVSEGQTVRKGQTIGLVGSTGWATGPHLHFEVRSNGTPVNPMKYL